MNEPSHGHDEELGELLDDAIDEIVWMQSKGLRPQLEDFIRRFPLVEEQLRETFPALLMLGHLHDGSNTSHPDAETIIDEHSREFPNRLGDFELHKEIGRGGMGVVYSATQISLNRPVALKILSRHLSTNPKFTARFLRESQSAARLQHPNIVQVFGNGNDQGFSFYAMQLIHGQSLERVLNEIQFLNCNQKRQMQRKDWHARTTALPISQMLAEKDLPSDIERSPKNLMDPLSLSGELSIDEMEWRPVLKSRSDKDTVDETHYPSMGLDHSGISSHRYYTNVARLAKSVASAIHYAHLNGIIHRDIKPSNLVLDDAGTIWVTDFGLAKLKTESDLTQTGDVMGTLRYIAPEQLDGESGASCDIYSLGATLYEMLTLQAVIRSDNKIEMMQQVREREPLLPRNIDPRIPIDLETITLKALEKDPKKRYQSGLEIAEELQRFLDGRPILARPTSSLERSIRWAKRNRPLAISIVALAMCLIVASIGSTIAAIAFRNLAASESASRLQANNEKQKAISASEETRNRLYISELSNGFQSVGVQGGLMRQREILSHWRPVPGSQDLRGWEWFYLLSQANQEEVILPSDHGIERFACSQNGSTIAWPGKDVVYIYDLASAQTKATIKSEGKELKYLQFDPSGIRLAARVDSKTVAIWNTEDGSQLATFKTTGEIRNLRWSPTGDTIATIVRSEFKLGEALVFTSIETLQSTVVIPNSICPNSAIFDFNSTGTRLAAACINPGSYADTTIRIWNTETWDVVKSLRRPADGLTALKWSPNGQRLASSSWEGLLNVWDTETWEQSFKASLTRSIGDIAWGPDGEWVAGGCSDATTLVWNVDTGKHTDTLLQHQAKVRQVEFIPNSGRFVTLDESNRICIWNPEMQRAERSMQLVDQSDAHQIDVSVYWSPDDIRIVAGAAFPSSVWSAASGRPLHSIVGSYANWSHDGKYLASKYNDPVSIWDGDSYSLIGQNDKLGFGLLRAWNPVDYRLAGVGPDSLWVWDVSNDTVIRSSEKLTNHPDSFKAIAWRPDGQVIAVGLQNGSLHLIDTQSLKTISKLKPFEGAIHHIAWNPEGTEMAVSAAHPSIRLVDAATGEIRHQLEAHAFEVWGLDWSPDGGRLASAGADGQVIVWDPRHQRALVSFRLDSEVRSVAWSHDGKKLAAVGQKGMVKLWSAEIGYRLESAMR